MVQIWLKYEPRYDIIINSNLLEQIPLTLSHIRPGSIRASLETETERYSHRPSLIYATTLFIKWLHTQGVLSRNPSVYFQSCCNVPGGQVSAASVPGQDPGPPIYVQSVVIKGTIAKIVYANNSTLQKNVYNLIDTEKTAAGRSSIFLLKI